MNRLVPAAALLLGLAIFARPGTAAAESAAYAIVIGHNQPPSGDEGSALPALRYADDDAVRYHRLLSRFTRRAVLLSTLDAATQARHRGVAAEAMPPTLDNLRSAVAEIEALARAAQARGARPVFYLVYSGHGALAEDGKAFLALQDGRLTREILYEILDGVPARYIHLIVDACHAGAVVGVRGPGLFDKELSAKTVPVARDEALRLAEKGTLAERPRVGALVATTLGQEAHEWSRIESGVFTHEVLSALAGAADVNGDRRIEYTEVQAFVAAANREIRDRRASPRVVAMPPEVNRNVPLIDLDTLAQTSLLKGKASGLGHYYIELESGERYLDAHLSGEITTVIAIPEGEAAYLRTRDREAPLPRDSTGPIELAEIELRARQVASRGSIDAAYRKALFAAPYGPTYYRGFVDSIGVSGVIWQKPQIKTVVVEKRAEQPAFGTWALAGASVLAGGIALYSGSQALKARFDYAGARTQREVKSASDRFDRHLTAFLTTGILAVGAGAAAWWLWPRGDSGLGVAPAKTGTGGAVTFRGRF